MPFEIYVKEGSNQIDATNVALDKSTASVAINETTTITATLTPSDATSPIAWTSSDAEKVVFMVNGVPSNTATGKTVTVKGLAQGTSAIVATANTHNATCVVTVTGTGA